MMCVCACDGSADGTTDDVALRALLEQAGFAANPLAGRPVPRVEEALPHLGKLLFFSKALSGDKDVACASCHLPSLGGGDGLALSIGVGATEPELLGPGRGHPSGRATVPRNAPTVFNMLLWTKVLFFDGRVEELTPESNDGAVPRRFRTPDEPFGEADPLAGETLPAAQARFPVTSVEEMRGEHYLAGESNEALRSALAERLRGDASTRGREELPGSRWLEVFRKGFGRPEGSAEELITFARIAEAIAAYEQSLTLVNAPLHAYAGGDDSALSDAAKRGAWLFYASSEQGGLACATCHSGSLMSDESFWPLGMPQVGPGKGDGADGSGDHGRFRETGREEDRFAFRTPSLLNIAVTGPYGHAGAYGSLEAVVRHVLDPQQAIDRYDVTQLDVTARDSYREGATREALARTQTRLDAGTLPLNTTKYNEEDVAALVAFLQEALTDSCALDAACMARFVPSDADLDPDGLRLEAHTRP